MKIHLFYFLLSLAMMFQLVNCSKPEPPEAESSAPTEPATQEVAVPQPAESPAEAAQVEEEPVPSAEELPIAQDFSEEFEAQIDEKNYRAELAAVEKEIEKDEGEAP